MSIEAMKQALDALEDSCTPRLSTKHCAAYDEAIDALRTAIEQAEKQKPVAYLSANGIRFDGDIETRDGSVVKLYTAPPQREWVSLTDEEMYKLWLCADEDNDRMSFGKAVETKLKEKNHEH